MVRFLCRLNEFAFISRIRSPSTHTHTQMVRQTNEAILYKKQINKLKMFQLINRGSVGDVPTSCLLRAHCRRTECIEHKYSVRAISLNVGCSIVGHDTTQTRTRTTTIRPFQWQQRKMSHKIINIFLRFRFITRSIHFDFPNFCFFFSSLYCVRLAGR